MKKEAGNFNRPADSLSNIAYQFRYLGYRCIIILYYFCIFYFQIDDHPENFFLGFGASKEPISSVKSIRS